MKAPRDDLAVLLDRDLLAGERHLLDERADHERLLEALRRAVDRDLNHSAILPLRIRPHAGVVQWQNGSFPSCIRGFDSLHPLHVTAPLSARPERSTDAPAARRAGSSPWRSRRGAQTR